MPTWHNGSRSSPHGGGRSRELDLSGRVTFLLGAEREGLPAEVERELDATIPIAGAESLNVAAAGAIALYEWRRQTQIESSPPRQGRAVEPAVDGLDREPLVREQLPPLGDGEPRERHLRLGVAAADAQDQRPRVLVPVGALPDARLALEPAAVRLGDVLGAAA